MLKYIDFYKRFGIRKAEQILRPPLPTVDRMMLPAFSLVHYLPSTPLEVGPNEDYFLFSRNKKPFRIEHILELSHQDGNPRKLPGDPLQKVRLWKRDHQRFKPMVDLYTARKDPTVIVVQNYSVIQHFYKYPKTINSAYYRTSNYIRTVFDNMERVSGKGYQQYLQMKLPLYIPTINELNLAQANMTTVLMKKFADPNLYFLLQLWMWIGPAREKSPLTPILNQICDEVNLIISENGRWSVLNLGVLNRMRGATREEVAQWEKDVKTDSKLPEPNREGSIPAAVQKRFLRMLMGVMDARRPDVDERLGDEVVETTQEVEATVGDNDDEDQSVSDAQTNAYETPLETVEDDASGDLMNSKEMEQTIELDLETLQEIQDNSGGLDEAAPETTPVTPSELNQSQVSGDADLSVVEMKVLEREATTGFTSPDKPIDNFKRLLARAADEGYVSVNDYRRFSDDVNRINNIDIKGEKLSEFVKVDPSKLAIIEPPKIPDRDTIVDKSMLSSTLLDFTSRYTRNVMDRDVSAMAVNLMNAGYCITDFTADEVEDITGARTEYTMKIKPIVGVATTVRFMIPKVQDDGTFMIGSTKYRTRMQRGD